MRTFVVAAALLLAACKSDAPTCSLAVGTCVQGSEHCGAQAACGQNTYELACTVPAVPDAKETDCKCIENGVIGKTVRVAFPISGNAGPVFKSACGWSLSF